MSEEVNVKLPSAGSEPEGTPGQVVPLGEAIRYRKRAQEAERRVSELTVEREQQSEAIKTARGEAEKVNREFQETREKLGNLEREVSIDRELGRMNVRDLETASLLVSHRLASDAEAGIEETVKKVLEEKPYLVRGEEERIRRELPGMLSGARGEASVHSGQHLARAAQKALGSGDRRDVIEYLRTRRSVK